MSNKRDLSQLKNVSEKDRKQIQQAQEMLGPDPERMGFVKNLFWGNLSEELVFPYPQVSAKEVARCDQLLAELDRYMRNEHPHVEIDQKQEIPDWVTKRLFDIGIMGMIIPTEYGGGGFSITSYNRALQHIFVFAYGSKQLGEFLLGVKESPFSNLGAAMQIGAELFLGIRRAAPRITRLHPQLDHMRRDLIPEKTPDDAALGTGRKLDTKNVPQFGEGSLFKPEDPAA